jgi:hypothetical protein
MKCISDRITTIDLLALSCIGLVSLLLIAHWDSLSSGIDTPYHLLMGKMFSDYDTVLLWDYYEFAPMGRPNLYPPLEHTIIWIMHDATGAGFLDIGRFIGLIQYPLSLLTVWIFCRKLFTSLVALAAVVFLSLSHTFWSWQISVAPTALIIALFPLFLYAYYTGRTLLSIALLSAFFYLHLGLPFIVIACIFIFSVLSLSRTTKYIRQFLIVTGFSVLIFLPWMIHILTFREWLRFSPHNADIFSSIIAFNILTLPFFIYGLVISYRRGKTDLKYLLLLSAVAGSLGILFYGWRFRVHSPIITCVVTAIGLEAFIITVNRSQNKRKMTALFIILLLPLGAFSLTFSYNLPVHTPAPMQNAPLPGAPQQQPPLRKDVSIRVHPTYSPVILMATSLTTGGFPPQMWQIWSPHVDSLVQWIQTNTSEDEILHVENGPLADYLALLTGRRTDSGMYREVTSEELFQAIREGKKSGILILEAEKRGMLPLKGMTVLSQFGNFLVIQGMKPEEAPAVLPFHLQDLFILLERPDEIPLWHQFIAQVHPRRVYVGTWQKTLGEPWLHQFISDLHSQGCEVGLSIIVQGLPLKDTIPRGISVVRLVVPQEKISYALIESVRASLDPSIMVEISVLGAPIRPGTPVSETLVSILPLVDRIVRHTPPNVESIRIVADEQGALGTAVSIQIDTYRGQYEITPDELYLLLESACSITGCDGAVIIEFRRPPTSLSLISFLKTVYAV